MKSEPLIESFYGAEEHLEPSEDFNYDEIDERNGWKEDGAESAIAGKGASRELLAFAKFASRCMEKKSAENQKSFFESIHALCYATHLHINQDRPLKEIASSLGLTMAGFAKQVNQFRDRLKLPRIAGAKSAKARESYKNKTKKDHARRNKEPNDKPTNNFSGLIKAAHSGAGSED